jgi:hypothetical protein
MAAIAFALLIPVTFVVVDEYERRRNARKSDVIDGLVKWMWR